MDQTRIRNFSIIAHIDHGKSTLADRLAAENPDLATIEHRKAKRGDRVFVDYLRNAYGQTSVAPYGVRARPGAPIATPLDWREALAKDMTPQRYGIKNLARRLAQKSDPWVGMNDKAVSISALDERLRDLS